MDFLVPEAARRFGGFDIPQRGGNDDEPCSSRVRGLTVEATLWRTAGRANPNWDNWSTMAFCIDPQLSEAAAPLLAALASSTPPAVGDWQSRREVVTKLLRRFSGALPANVQVSRVAYEIATADGARLSATWYLPQDRAVGAAALFLHGGGMILGSVSVFDRMIAMYVASSGVPLLAVDYRLAPEHPHPTPVEDCYAGLVWLHDHAADLDIDAARIGIIGESAGGGLAAAVTLLARERAGPAIARQILVYPMLDDRTAGPDVHIESSAFWTYGDNVTGWQALLGNSAGSAHVEPSAAPGRCTDFTGLPPAYLEVGEIDIFRDEVIRYANGLLAAGVSTELHVLPGAPHSFEWIAPHTELAARAFADRIRWLRGL